MNEVPLTIITCPHCHVKNRIRKYEADRVPVCARCKKRLVTPEEHEAYTNYEKKLNDFLKIPDINSI